MQQKKLSETAFASQVEDLFRIFNWRWTHFRPAWSSKGWRTPLTGDKGLLDYIAVRPPRLIFAELKDQYSKLTPEQDGWLNDLKECQVHFPDAPLEILGRDAVLHGLAKAKIICVPEVYLWRPSDFDEIKGILE